MSNGSNGSDALKQTFQEAVDALTKFHGTLEPKRLIVRAVLGNAAGTVAVPNLPNHVYARIDGDPSKLVRAQNYGAPPVAGTVVSLEIVQNETGRIGYIVLGKSSGVQYPGTATTPPALGPHHLTHEMQRDGGGYDGVNVYEEALVMLRANAQATPNLTVKVSRGTYYLDSTRYYYAGGNSPTFVADGDSIDVLCINAAGVLSIVQGTHGAWGAVGPGGYQPVGTAPPFPTIADSLLPIAAINIRTGMTQILEADFGADPRPFLHKGVTIRATQVGQVMFSTDGASMSAQLPLTDANAGWLVDETTGVMLVVDGPSG
jgi:hypothetical protein